MDWKNYYPNEYIKDLRILTQRDDSPLPTDNKGHLYFCGHHFSKWMEEIDEVLPAANIAAVLYTISLEVLMDELIYTYFPLEYPEYENLTRYPKFSDCFSQCYNRKNPFALCRYNSRSFRLDRILRYKEKKGHLFRGDERIVEIYGDITKSFFNYQKRLLSKRFFSNYLPNYEEVVNKIFSDEDVAKSGYGEFISEILSESKEIIRKVSVQRDFVKIG